MKPIVDSVGGYPDPFVAHAAPELNVLFYWDGQVYFQNNVKLCLGTQQSTFVYVFEGVGGY